MKVLLDIQDSKAQFFMELLNSFKFVKTATITPGKVNKKNTEAAKQLVLEKDTDKAIEKGFKSKMIEEKKFEIIFKKHSAKWRKYYSE